MGKQTVYEMTNGTERSLYVPAEYIKGLESVGWSLTNNSKEVDLDAANAAAADEVSSESASKGSRLSSSWTPWALGGGGALASYALASSLVDDLYDSKKKRGNKEETVWDKVLRKLIPVGAGVLGGYGGYRLGESLDNMNKSAATAGDVWAMEHDDTFGPTGAAAAKRKELEDRAKRSPYVDYGLSTIYTLGYPLSALAIGTGAGINWNANRALKALADERVRLSTEATDKGTDAARRIRESGLSEEARVRGEGAKAVSKAVKSRNSQVGPRIRAATRAAQPAAAGINMRAAEILNNNGTAAINSAAAAASDAARSVGEAYGQNALEAIAAGNNNAAVVREGFEPRIRDATAKGEFGRKLTWGGLGGLGLSALAHGANHYLDAIADQAAQDLAHVNRVSSPEAQAKMRAIQDQIYSATNKTPATVTPPAKK